MRAPTRPYYRTCWQKRADAGTPAREGRDLQTHYDASERQVCFPLKISRSSCRSRSVAADDSALRLRISEITKTRMHYGCRHGSCHADTGRMAR